MAFCIFRDNSAVQGVGALVVQENSLIFVTNSTFIENAGVAAGGLLVIPLYSHIRCIYIVLCIH